MTAPTPSNLHLKPPLPSPAPPPLSPPPQQPPLLLTIRFSASIPDLELDIPHPSSTTVISLKHLIRSRLTEPNSQRRLRFIHSGKILPDNAVLSSVLRAPPPPPPPPPSSNTARTPSSYGVGVLVGGGGDRNGYQYGDGKDGDKGKDKGKSIPGRPVPPQRIYVNCSIGDSLTTAELSAEAVAASAPPSQIPQSPFLQTTSSPLRPSPFLPPGTPVPSTSTAPRGFDRLLSTGFSASEVNQLRLQFRSIHSSRYTPDTLPSPDGFRRMEDAWIDDNGSSMPTSTLGGGAAAGVGGGAMGMGGAGGGTDSDDVGIVAMVDVMIRGVITGFMWPLGSAGWLTREEGMASGRWRFMVAIGVLFSLLIGIIRAISGEK